MIFLEARDGKIKKPGLEMISVGAIMAHKVNEILIGITFGEKVGTMVKEAGEYGCDRVIGYESPDLKDFRTIPYATLLSDLIQELKPNILLIPATRNGRDLASRIAVRSRTGVTADCTELDVDPNGRILQARRPTYGESTLADINLKPEWVGLKGSPTIVKSMRTINEKKREGKKWCNEWMFLELFNNVEGIGLIIFS